jgi:hypothetical protein
MANAARRHASPANEMRTVRADRKRNARLRTREYLTEPEVVWCRSAIASRREEIASDAEGAAQGREP